ncbi:MAG: hypothetical protein ACHQJX_06770 [Candidatus Acidiferrales bacterium]
MIEVAIFATVIVDNSLCKGTALAVPKGFENSGVSTPEATILGQAICDISSKNHSCETPND